MSSFITKIPRSYISHTGKLIGNLIYLIDTRHRRIVKHNLQFAYPEFSQNHIKQVSKRVFRNIAITVLEICQLTFFSRQDVLNNVEIKGENHLLAASGNPNGSILITAHIGNWEMAAVFVCCYLKKPVVAIARGLNSKIIGLWINKMRTRLGNSIIDKKGALPKMARTLRSGNLLGILIDQATSRAEGLEVDFFEKTVTATPAAAILARRYNCPVIPAFCVRNRTGELSLIVEPALNLSKTDDPDKDIQINTQLMTTTIEKAVRAYPEQWLWLHKRWKRHYPYLYPDYVAKKNRSKTKMQNKGKIV